MGLNILVDKALVNADKIFSVFGQVTLKEGRSIQASDLKDIDALIIRSVTKVNKDLLSMSNKLKFVGTATAGFDHIDINLLKEYGIAFSSAPGSNKESVGDYVLSTLLYASMRHNLDFTNKSIGVIGCGNTGSQVCTKAQALGLKLVKCDPIRKKDGDISCDASFLQAISCDIVSLHVPLIKQGEYKTYHMLNETNFNYLKDDVLLINASRGDVIDNVAFCNYLKKHDSIKAYFDVFEGEPQILCHELLSYLQGASAHIAGYSYESKIRASYMLAKELAKVLALSYDQEFKYEDLELTSLNLADDYILDLNLIRRLVNLVYNVQEDHYKFKHYFKDKESFDALRKNYRQRHELQTLVLNNVRASDVAIFKALGFSV